MTPLRMKPPKGVVWHKGGDKWYARGRLTGQSVSLYWGEDYFEACCARKSWEVAMADRMPFYQWSWEELVYLHDHATDPIKILVRDLHGPSYMSIVRKLKSLKLRPMSVHYPAHVTEAGVMKVLNLGNRTVRSLARETGYSNEVVLNTLKRLAKAHKVMIVKQAKVSYSRSHVNVWGLVPVHDAPPELMAKLRAHKSNPFAMML